MEVGLSYKDAFVCSLLAVDPIQFKVICYKSLQNVNFCFIFDVNYMKIRLIKKQTIENYIKSNAQSLSGFETWLAIIKYSDWNDPLDIIKSFNSADILGNSTNRVVFNIGGNKYRMICSYHFGKSMIHVFICWIGTHSKYDELCDKELQYTVNDY